LTKGWYNRLIDPASEDRGNTGYVQKRERLGGLLSYYYRDAA
jgi:hypothetical protein